jgi:hypothetical protein
MFFLRFLLSGRTTWMAVVFFLQERKLGQSLMGFCRIFVILHHEGEDFF